MWERIRLAYYVWKHGPTFGRAFYALDNFAKRHGVSRCKTLSKDDTTRE